MHSDFWHQKWQDNEIGFHEKQANPRLTENIARLGLSTGSRIFLPLCGKTLDIGWLLGQGYRVVGAELSELAIQQLFDELGVTPTITKAGTHMHYQAPDLDVYAGDFFDLTRSQTGEVTAIYDRAALVALPADMRTRYAAHLMDLTGIAPQLLVCFDYDQSQQPGPPFSVPGDEVHRHYDRYYHVTQIASHPVPGGLKGKCAAEETVWLLEKR